MAKPVYHIVVLKLICCFFLSGCLESLRTSDTLSNDFFAMDTATKDSTHQTASEQMEILKELGYDGLGYWRGSGGLETVLEELDKHRLKAYPVYLYVSLDKDADPYDKNLKRTVELLKDRPGVTIWLPIYSKTYANSSPAGDNRAIEILLELSDLCEKNNVKIALYPHYASWLETTEDALRVVKKVNRSNVGLTFNLCHFLAVGGTDYKPLLKEAMPHLLAVTINGADTVGGTVDWKRLIQPLGKGSYDTFEFVKTLHELNYKGPIGFQGYGVGGDVHQNLKQTIDTWNKYKQQINSHN